MRTVPAIFHAPDSVYHADTCEPVRAAADQGRLTLHALVHGAYPGTQLPPRLLPEIRTVGCWDAPLRQDWGLDYHRNEGLELTYVSGGHLDFAVDGRAFPLRQGHLTITRPWQAHRVGDPHLASNRLLWLILDVGVRRPNQTWRWPRWLVLSRTELDRLTTLLSHNEKPVWTADAAVAGRFEDLAQLTAAPDAARLQSRLVLGINSLLLAVLDLLERQDPELDTSLTGSQRTVELFLAELTRRIEHPWSVDGMARQCGLERTRFTHLCRQTTGAAPMAYLTRCRVEAARTLLREQPERSITDIAMDCGFGSSQYFATVYRAHTGRTPRAEREG